MKRLVIILAGVVAGIAAYTGWDMYRAHSLVADVCARAVPGHPVEAIVASVSKADLKVVAGQDRTIIVARSGFGRYHCAILHDGTRIRSAAVASMD